MPRLAMVISLIPLVALGDGVTGKITQATCKFNGSNVSVSVSYNLNTKHKKIRPPTVCLSLLCEKTDASRVTAREIWCPGFLSEQYDAAKIKSGVWKANLPVRESQAKKMLAWRAELRFQDTPLDARMSMPAAEMEKRGLGTNWWSTASP